MAEEVNTLNYTQAMKELTTLVKKWENDQPDLSQAAADLERAAFLVKYCRDYLRTVEQKVEEVGMA
jgi:exodeoxyribonuclease VII small subunit